VRTISGNRKFTATSGAQEYLFSAATGSGEALTSATALRLGDGRGALGVSGASSVCAVARTTRRGHVGASRCGGWRKLEAASNGNGKDDEASICLGSRLAFDSAVVSADR